MNENSSKLMVVFEDQRPDSLLLQDMYDPDIHGTGYLTTEEAESATGKIIPKPGSSIFDKTTDILYYAYSTDPVTFKTTIRPARILILSEEDNTYILDYGNDRFMLYWDDRVRPTKLVIDSKLIIFGNTNTEYRLVRYVDDPETGKKEEQIISIYLNSNDEFFGNRIPLADIVQLTGAKFPTNCHTNFDMRDGDTVYLEVYNNVGMLSAKITLFTKRAVILNDLASAANPILNFDATCLQMRGDEWFIYEKQDPSHLGIIPFVEYANNTKKELVIDGSSVILYGLEDYIPSYPGYKTKLLLKYFLNAKEQSPFTIFGGKHRYLAVEKDLIVVSNDSDYSIKLSVIPVFNKVTYAYDLKFIAYSTNRDKIYDVTNLIKIENKWDGRLLFKEQLVTYKLEMSSLFGISTSVIYRQSSWITLFPYNEYQRYLIKDSENATKVFGVESSLIRRPVIHYDKILQMYFVPTSVFKNKEAFLEAFYYSAAPPYNTASETEEPLPTHFTIRDMDMLNTIIMMPIEIEQFEQAWNIIKSGNTNQLVGNSVIVEFLRKSNDKYLILYGTPVDVYESLTGYQG